MSLEHADIVARLAVLEVELRGSKEDMQRFEKHVGQLYGKIDSLNRWLMALLGAALLNLAVLLFRG